MPRYTGIWFPIVTPFADGKLDLTSLRGLIDHAIAGGVHGIIPLGTTGEAPTLSDDEITAVVDTTVTHVAGRVPVLIGVGGNSTAKVISDLHRLERFPAAGILSVCPYYNRPPQDGLYEHFRQLANETSRDILVYNIPYRTGVNMTNDTLLRLAELPRIAGVKDSSGNVAQSLELLRRRPADFSVLTGEDAYLFTMLANGGDGGILAASHLRTERFVQLWEHFRSNDLTGARAVWNELAPMIALLFAEPNPMPLKYALWREGLIRSPECRLPLTRISAKLAGAIDEWLAGWIRNLAPQEGSRKGASD